MELIHRVILRLNKEDHKRLKEVASKSGMTVSKFVRQIISQHIWR